ncbi:MAG: hypothetical protein HY236_04300 [Acidobacteria bacterium]|nr:hypothetical protein [Acidobacteriota bacterium]
MRLFLTAAFLACGIAWAQTDDPAPSEGRGESRFSLSLGNETSFYSGLRVPGPSEANLVLLQPAFAYRQGQRWRFSTSLAGLVSTHQESQARLRVKETYFSVSAWDLDLTAGKKILRWGAGYAFTPTGVLDPPRIATDPTDRLNLNEGREMATADWIHGRHAVTAAWASGGLLDTHRPGMRETAAFRYNTLVAGFDTSVIVAHDRGGSSFTGANFTQVFGESVEIHGEFAHRNASAVLLGGSVSRPPPLWFRASFEVPPARAAGLEGMGPVGLARGQLARWQPHRCDGGGAARAQPLFVLRSRPRPGGKKGTL